MLAIIGKTARVARFIRSSTAVKLASRIHWFPIVDRLNPFSWFRRRKKAAATDVTSRITSVDILERRASWTDVILKSKIQRSMPPTTNGTSLRGIVGVIMKGLRAIGILKDNKQELRRQMAATRIQRTWRLCRVKIINNNNVDPDYYENHGYEDDVAWKGKSYSSNNLDRGLKKRSIIQQSLTSANSNVSDRMKQGKERTSDHQSQVGSAMRQLTANRVAIGIIVGLYSQCFLRIKK